MSWDYSFAPYVPVAQRRAKARLEVERRRKKGMQVSPVAVASRKIVTTFWGTAWCENLEAYSDFANRLPRGRTYVRNGSVVHLQIDAGKVTAIVSGSNVYDVTINIAALPKANWANVKSRCGGRIGSLVELLQGRLSKHVMEVVTERERGLFPKPNEIEMSCSCPDWAGMCKHIAAVMYGVGARLDTQPETLFKLRKVDHRELIDEAGAAKRIGTSPKSNVKTISTGELADVFGIEFAQPAEQPIADANTPPPRRANTAKTSAGKTLAGKRQTKIAVKKVKSKSAKPARKKRRPAAVGAA